MAIDKLKEIQRVEKEEQELREQESLKVIEMYKMTQTPGWQILLEEIHNQVTIHRDLCSDAPTPEARQRAWEIKETWLSLIELVNAWTIFETKENE